VSEPLRETPGDATPQPTWLARVHVTLKPVVLDPQGDAVLMGLHQLGFASVSAVRVGKYLELTLAADDEQAAAAAVRLMCERLLANPVIERYDFSVTRRDAASPH
jgi:phosphoribosylformylglycinamidine synthase subunit PurS